MKAIILAAGKGSRLGDITSNTPKALTSLWQEPLFERQLRLLNEVGIDDIAVVTGYLHQAFAQYPVKKYLNLEFDNSNMVHSLLSAKEFLFPADKPYEPIIILYGDIAYNVQLLQKLIASTDDLLIPGNSQWLNLWQQRMHEPLLDAESFIYEPVSLQLKQLGQPLASQQQAMAQFMGVLKLGVKGLQAVQALINQHEHDTFRHYAMTDFIQLWIDSGLLVTTSLIDGNWIELDTVDDFDLYQQFSASHFILN